MKFTLKLTSLLLIAAMLFSLAACAGNKEQTDQEKLYAILDDIADSVQPGTAGGGMRAVKIAARLISWASSTKMTGKEAAAAVGQWLKDQPQEKKDAFKEQMVQVAEAYGKIALDGAKDLLESAGVEEKIGDLTGSLKSIIESILASGGID